jgi:L-arabinose isomerase
MKVKNGAVTLLSVCQGADGNIFLLVAEGESVAGETLQIGNTNSRYKFPIPITQFINEWGLAGPSHHCAIVFGHTAHVFKKYTALIGIECKVVC